MGATRDIMKKTRPAQTGIGVLVRLQPDQLAALDAWIARHPDPKPSRPEAIRLVLSGALGGDRPSTTIPSKVTGRDIV
jgi:cytochrome c553